jgi:uncharacterized protein YacL
MHFLFSGLFGVTGGVLMYYVSNTYLALLKAWQQRPPQQWAEVLYRSAFVALGALVAVVIAGPIFRQVIELGSTLRRVPTLDKVAAGAGLVIGVTMTALLGILLYPWVQPAALFFLFLLLIGVVTVYLVSAALLSLKDELSFIMPKLDASQRAEPHARIKLLDTNVIIDGRIADIFRSGFVEGPVYIPDFILQELHDLADSQDTLKRNRSRRGLDVLQTMKNEFPGLVEIYDNYERPYLPSDGADVKLVKLAKMLDAAVVTNDFNLNKIASLQSVPVMNVNELANAMKPAVLPGEELMVNILREGKEPDQGVAYLDDGTMVVVENGRSDIGKTVTIVVSTVFQTAAGKMIFGAIKSTSHRAEVPADADFGAYSGGRPRRKTRPEAF